jgi:hypothetical protein
MMDENTMEAVADLTPEQVIDRIEADGETGFTDLVSDILGAPEGRASLFSLPSEISNQHVATVLALTGKTLEDLRAAVAAERERRANQ